MSSIGQNTMCSEPGVRPAADIIPLGIPEINGNEWKYVKECLDTNWVSSAGPFVERFEQMVAGYLGARGAVATVNGTAALHIALLATGVQPDDEVLVSTLTFIAPANAVRYIGAWPVFMDADPRYWQMDVAKVMEFLESECRWQNGRLQNKATGRRVKAILPVHILGHPCDMDPILEIARKYDLVVIEDATESLGADYKERKVGCLGDIACLSFNGNKIITTGGGGMIVSNDSEWTERAKYLTTQAKDNPIEYIHHEIGYNYRLSNIQAALGCAQMERLEEFVATKRRIAMTYREELAQIPGIDSATEASWAASTFWLYTVLVNKESYGRDRCEVMRLLETSGVESRPLWQPLHLSPAHKGSQSYRCETAGEIYRDSLSLPSSVSLSGSDQRRVIGILKEADLRI